MAEDGAVAATETVAAPPEGWAKQECDGGCGRAYSLVITDVDQREVDLLCWPCLAGRAVEVIRTLTEPADTAGSAQTTG